MHCAIDRTTLRSIIDTGLRLLSAEAHFTHTLAQVRSNTPWCDQAHSIENPHMTLFRSLSSFSPSFLHCAVQHLSFFFSLSHHHNTSTLNHHPTAQTLSHHHHSTTGATHYHRRPSHHPISIFLHFFPIFSQTQLLLQILILSPFLNIQRHNPSTDYAILLSVLVVFSFCRGLR